MAGRERRLMVVELRLERGPSLVRTPPGAEELLERWRLGSLDAAWSRPSDWYDPAVDALVEAVAERRDAVPAADRLGRARAAVGVGLTEALDDLAALYLAAGASEPPLPVVRALAVAWVDAGVSPVRSRACEDPLTGLATASYLRLRMKETYARAARTHVPASLTHCLVVLDAQLAEAHPWQRMARACVLGAAMAEVFDGGDPLAALPGGRFVALARRDEELNPALARLRDVVEDRVGRAGLGVVVRRPPRIWVEGLPPDAQVALMMLDELER
jgi:hypothetical protein